MEQDNTIRLVSFDPGNGFGVSALEWNFEKDTYKILDSFVLDLKNVYPNSEEEDKRETSIKRLQYLKDFLKRYLKLWSPDFIAHETAFVPGRNGGGASIYSYASLIENIITIKFSCLEVMSDAKIFEVNPNNVKIVILGERKADKSLILKALQNDKKVDLSLIDQSKLNQHSADAIAIGITCIRENLKVSSGLRLCLKLRGKTNGRTK